MTPLQHLQICVSLARIGVDHASKDQFKDIGLNRTKATMSVDFADEFLRGGLATGSIKRGGRRKKR